MDKKYQIEISFGNYKITKYFLSKRKSDLESDKNMTLKLQTDNEEHVKETLDFYKKMVARDYLGFFR